MWDGEQLSRLLRGHASWRCGTHNVVQGKNFWGLYRIHHGYSEEKPKAGQSRDLRDWVTNKYGKSEYKGSPGEGLSGCAVPCS